MKRRDFLKCSTLAAAGALASCRSTGGGSSSHHTRPNILFIMTDQQHAGMMSCMGNPWLKTPALDGLAASGVRFERAYVSNPVCMPSRFSLQTGRMPSAIGLGTNDDTPKPLLTDAMREESLGPLFSRAGYEVAYSGKVHLPKSMTDVGVLGYRNLTPNSRQELADACAAFLREKHERPFLLFASFINPHDICYMAINDFRRSQNTPPFGNVDSKTVEAVLDQARNSGDLAGFVEKYCPPVPENYDVPGGEPDCIKTAYVDAVPFRAFAREHWTAMDWRLHRWAYCRLMEQVDREIGQVLDALRDAGLEEDTLVVFTSDHGDMDASHRLEHKSVLYEEAVHVPMILSYKGAIPEGKAERRHLVHNGLDLLPTLCDFAGIEPPEGLSGRSLRPLATGRPASWRDFVVSESQNGRMLRTDRYKYCVYDSGQHRELLTDCRADAGEMRNLAEDPGAKRILEEHRARLRQWVARVGDGIGAQYIV